MSEEEFHRDIGRLYSDLEQELSKLGVNCRACGHCCHFDEVDHVLYASASEVKYLLSCHRPVIDPLPGRCPYQKDESCHAREGRFLGCRLHFCDVSKEQATRLEDISEKYHQRLKQIHARHNVDWHYTPALEAIGKLSS